MEGRRAGDHRHEGRLQSSTGDNGDSHLGIHARHLIGSLLAQFRSHAIDEVGSPERTAVAK